MPVANMDNLYRIAVCILAISVVDVSGGWTKITVWPANVTNANTVTLTCQLSNCNGTGSIHLKKKKVPIYEVPVCGGDAVLESDVEESRRYMQPQRSVNGSTLIYTMTINDFQLGDSGTYSCTWINSTSSVLVERAVEPVGINFTVGLRTVIPMMPGATSPQRVPVDLSARGPLVCTAYGSNPGANISITSGDNPVGPVVVTTSNRSQDLTENVFNTPVPRITTAIIDNFQFNINHIGRPFTCTAGVLVNQTISFIPWPLGDAWAKFVCNDTATYNRGALSAEIQCSAWTGDNATRIEVHFIYKGMNITLTQSSRSNPNAQGFSFQAVKNDAMGNFGWWTLSLTVPTPDTQSTTQYNFIAANQFGPVQHVVMLQQSGTASPTPPNAATCRMPSYYSVLLLLLMVVAARLS